MPAPDLLANDLHASDPHASDPHAPGVGLATAVLRDPAGALHAVHRHAQLRPGAVVLALFARPGSGQALLGTVRIWDAPTPPRGVRSRLPQVAPALRLLSRRGEAEAPTSGQTNATSGPLTGRDPGEHGTRRAESASCGTPDPADQAEPPAVVTVVARRGPVVLRDGDLGWLAAFRMAMRGRGGSPGDADGPGGPGVGELLLITEHGFRSSADGTGGRHPALTPAPPGTATTRRRTQAQACDPERDPPRGGARAVGG